MTIIAATQNIQYCNLTGFNKFGNHYSANVMLHIRVIIVTFLRYDIEKLIMLQKLEPRTTGLKPTKTGHVDRVNNFIRSDAFHIFS